MQNVPSEAGKTNGGQNTAGNPLIGIAAGFGGMLAGTALWIAIAQKYQVSWMSIVVAFGIASAARYAGKLTIWWPGIICGVFSLLSALIGNLATAIFIVSKRGKTPGEILSALDLGTAVTFLKALSGPMGVIFYLLAIYVGFWFSYKHLPKTPGELPD
ncbi:MAG: hypothetical protein JW863_23195 [Chitinispirillaceae bacterium]|nr:hypothetical protein [Chitinispirillaceae bacterium]